MEVRGRGREIYLSLHCHHQNDSCIKMGSDESHFNVSVGSNGQSHRTVSTNHNLFEEKGRAEAVSNWGPSRLTSLTPVLNWANVCSPNRLRTVRRTVIRFLIERLVRRTWFGQFDEFYFSLSQLAVMPADASFGPELPAYTQQTAWSSKM